MSRPNPPRGASRSPRPAGKAVNTGRGGRRTTKTASKSAPAKKPGIKKGRLIVGLLLLAGLVTLIVMLMKKPAPPVATVPPALAEDQVEKPKPAPKPAERFAFYELLPNQKVLPTRTVDTRPAPRPNPNVTAVSNGSFWLQTDPDTREAVTAESLPAEIRALRKVRGDVPVLVNGDREVGYGRVIELMSSLQQGGVKQVGLLTELPAAK